MAPIVPRNLAATGRRPITPQPSVIYRKLQPVVVITMTLWVEGIEGDFPLHEAVVEGMKSKLAESGDKVADCDVVLATAMPNGAKATASESWGISAWTQTAKVTAILPDGTEERYFSKVGTLPDVLDVDVLTLAVRYGQDGRERNVGGVGIGQSAS